MTLFCLFDDVAAPVEPATVPTDAQRLTHDAHMIRNKAGARIGAPGNHRAATAAELAECAAILAAAGHDIDATTDAGEPLRCPVCLAPLRASATAETWAPPEGLPPDPVPTPVLEYVDAATNPTVLTLTSEWQIAVVLTTALGGLRSKRGEPLDVARTVAAIVGRVEATGGTVLLRLVREDATGEQVGVDQTLLDVALDEGSHPYAKRATSAGALTSGPAEYRFEVKLGTATAGQARGMSLTLFEVQP